MDPFHGRAGSPAEAPFRLGKDRLEARYIVVAAGARPATLHIPGENLLRYSDDFLELDTLPGSIVFIGGGYIAFEFAHLAALAGVQATILHRGSRPLEKFDPDLVQRLLEHTRSLGIDVQLQTQAERIDGEPGRIAVHSGSRRFQAEMAVHAAGRVPDVDDLDLEAAGVEREKHGVKVNEFLQSVSNPAVYAAGDAAAGGGAPLTPVAGYQGRIVASNLLNGNRRTPDYTGLASVVFSIPPLASTGLREEAARESGFRFQVRRGDTANWYSSRRVNETVSGFKVLVELETDRILGAHLLGEEASEHINLFAMAIRFGIKARDLRDTLFAYPNAWLGYGVHAVIL